jgi:hypothetical protein
MSTCLNTVLKPGVKNAKGGVRLQPARGARPARGGRGRGKGPTSSVSDLAFERVEDASKVVETGSTQAATNWSRASASH